MQQINSLADLLVWIVNSSPANVVAARPDKIGDVLSTFSGAKDLPAWGSDWEPWLEANAEQLAIAGMSDEPLGGYAAVGSDGKRIVVWGIGQTADGARKDGVSEMVEQCEAGKLTVVPISAEQHERIAEGIVDCESLGMDTKTIAKELGFDVRGAE